MDTWDWVAIAAAIAAIVSAVVAVSQAKEAKRQAAAAEATVGLMRKQVEQAETANALTEKALAEEKAARTVALTLRLERGLIEEGRFLDIDIQNTGHVDAHIQEIALVLKDGKRSTPHGSFRGSVQLRGEHTERRLPAELTRGHRFRFRFCDWAWTAYDALGRTHPVPIQPTDEEVKWDEAEFVEVVASNRTFRLPVPDDFRNWLLGRD